MATEKINLIEKYCDNGEFSHYELIDTDGVTIWAGNYKETFYFPDKYIQKFANKMMDLSNRLNEIEEPEDGYIESDDYDIKETYLSHIKEFISRTTGL